jgi:ribosomal protein S18 acetylase RimI-like enzyme
VVSIRRLEHPDVSAYRPLMLEAYELHPDAFTSSASERSALPISWWESRLSAAHDTSELVLGAFDAHRLVGVAGLSFEKREKARHKATLFGMYVPSSRRHMGLGSALVLAALEQARQRRGTRLVQLTVTDGNEAARSLYERCGFVQFGLEPLAVAVGDGFVSKVHMWCDLEGPT